MTLGFFQILMLVFLAFLFFLPTYIAVKKQHKHKVSIILINVILGLFWGIGWLIALIWALVGDGSEQVSDNSKKVGDDSEQATLKTAKVNNNPTSAQELELLQKLKLEGVITEEAFNKQKNAILNDTPWK